jgi:uroporphyrinogen-III synthase
MVRDLVAAPSASTARCAGRPASWARATFAVSTLRLQALRAGAELAQALRCPRVLATSPAAVRFAGEQRALRMRAGQHWFAPGAGTAAALRRAGIERVHFPARGAGAEALLDDPLLRELTGARIGLLTAPGGRELLPAQLRARGARLVVAEVYRREPLRPPPARLRALAALPPRTALLLSSGEALSSLWRNLDEAGRAALRTRPCIASSARLAAQARELGLRAALHADDARPERMLAALAAQASGFR